MLHSNHVLVSFRSFQKFKAKSRHISVVSELHLKMILNCFVYVLHYVQLFLKYVEDCKEFHLVFPWLPDLENQVICKYLLPRKECYQRIDHLPSLSGKPPALFLGYHISLRARDRLTRPIFYKRFGCFSLKIR